MRGPRITSGSDSIQEVQTPPEFIEAVKRRFGPIIFDLAANSRNTQASQYFCAPDKIAQNPEAIAEDALDHDWEKLPRDGVWWCNPPYKKIFPWLAKIFAVQVETKEGFDALFLLPASVGSVWFAELVAYKADVYFLRPRLTFVGSKAPYPKDLLICHFKEDVSGLLHLWDWREDKVTHSWISPPA